MFTNVGKKLKIFAAILFFIYCIAGIATGIVLLGDSAKLTFIGIIVIVLSPIISEILVLPLYGFGIIVNHYEQKTPTVTKKPEEPEVYGLCSNCGYQVFQDQTTCPNCGQENPLNSSTEETDN